VNPSSEPVLHSSADASNPAGGALLPRVRLRTRFLISMLVITAGLTTTSFLLVQRSVQTHVRQSIAINLRDSVSAFQDFRRERETMLTNDVALMAALPITRSIMSNSDPLTIQDASRDVWRIASFDLFVLVNESGKVVALHNSH
jgi:hypothetical protein